MLVTIKLNDPSQLVAVMTVTAPLEDFIALRKWLNDHNEHRTYYAWPVSGLCTALDQAITNASRTFSGDVKQGEQP
jgi:hypothetical protein